MTRSSHHVRLAPAYILHHRPYRDTSRILEIASREFGRLTVFARGVRGPKVRFGTALQPFNLVLLSWSGRGEAPYLTGVELSGEPRSLAGAALMPAFYLNELILKLTARHDPAPELFDLYHATLESLKDGAPIAPALREFERQLLAMLGYGGDLTAVLEACLEGRELKTRAVARSIRETRLTT